MPIRVGLLIAALVAAVGCGGRGGLGTTGSVVPPPDGGAGGMDAPGNRFDGAVIVPDGGTFPGFDGARPDLTVFPDGPPRFDGPGGGTLIGIGVTPTLTTIGVGTTVSYTVTGRFSDGSTRDVTSMATWTSSNMGVATLTGSVARAVGPGMTSIRATVLGQSGMATLTVTGSALTSISVEPADVRVGLMSRIPLRAVGLFADGTKQDLTLQVMWSSSDTSIATVATDPGSAGVVTGIRVGTTTLVARFGTTMGQATVTVTTATLTSLEVSPASPTLPLNGSQRFSATAIYSDGTKSDVSALVAWESSNQAVLTIVSGGTSSGDANARSAGTSTVTARLGGVAGMTTVTVSRSMLTGIKIAPDPASIPRGAAQAFRATGTYADGTSADVTSSVAWSSSDDRVATVSNAAGSEGIATGLTAGGARVTATLGGVSGSAMLTVTDFTVTALGISPRDSSVAIAATGPYVATATFSDGSTRDVTQQATWSVGDGTIASISNVAGTAGQLSGIKAGMTTVTGAYMGKSDTTNVTVSTAVLNGITVMPASLPLIVGVRQNLTATAMYSDGTSLDVTRQVTWSSDDMAVATASNVSGANGQVLATGVGTTTVRARLSGKEGTAQVTVADKMLTQLSVAPINPTRRVGDGALIVSASAIYNNGTSMDVSPMAAWMSSDEAVATIVVDMFRARATCVAKGTATLRATYMGVSDTTVLTCTMSTVTMLRVTPPSATLFVGERALVQATAIYSDGSAMNVNNQATWTTSNAAAVDVSTGGVGGPGGLVTAIGAGMAAITASYMGLTATAAVTVSNATITSLNVSPNMVSLRMGQTQQLLATAIFSDGQSRNVTNLATWTAADDAIADVTNTGGPGGPGGTRGQVTAIKPGTTTVTATYMGVSDTATITVSAATLTGINVSPVMTALVVRQQQQLQAVALYSDGGSTNITFMATWTSSDATVVDVSNGFPRGVITGIKGGSATITATFMGMSGTSSVTVSTATLMEIQVTPTNPTIPANTTQPFAATAIFSDFSTQNVTNTATWSSSNAAVADVSNGFGRGVATGLMAGMSTITATYMGMMGSSVLTVTGATIKEIQVTPTNSNSPIAVNVQFQATALMTDNSTRDLTNTATWTSSDETVAAISNGIGSRGLATSLKAGPTTIKATVMGLSGQTTYTVGSQTLSTITIVPAMGSVAKGARLTFTATGNYSDGSTWPITLQATWISTTTTVATISNAAGSRGQATGVEVGTTSIEAHFQGKTGTTPLSVTP